MQKNGVERMNRGVRGLPVWHHRAVFRCRNDNFRPFLAFFQIFLVKTLKFPKVAPLPEGEPAIRPENQQSEWDMTSNEVLSMYENIATLTGTMTVAAQTGDAARLAQLETRCVIEGAAAVTGVPALDGEKRLRKVELLKQILANDRAIREVTEPWMGQLEAAMCAH
jgi:flagellar protein FliT